MSNINKFKSEEIIIAIEDSLYQLLPTLDELIFKTTFISKAYFIINHKYSDFQLEIDYRFLNNIYNKEMSFNSLNNIILNGKTEEILTVYKILYQNNKFELESFVKKNGYKGIDELRRYLNDLDDFLRIIEKDISNRISL